VLNLTPDKQKTWARCSACCAGVAGSRSLTSSSAGQCQTRRSERSIFGPAELPALCWKQSCSRRSSLPVSPISRSPGRPRSSTALRRHPARARLARSESISGQPSLEPRPGPYDDSASLPPVAAATLSRRRETAWSAGAPCAQVDPAALFGPWPEPPALMAARVRARLGGYQVYCTV